jgi:protein-tyrosine phosphatase
MKILFVCLGNICRSPLAEGVFRKLVLESGRNDIEADSAGTGGWHVGESPDSRMRRTAERHGVSLEGIQARKFKRSDFDEYDLILAMDRSVYRDILSMAGDSQHEKVKLFRSFDDVDGSDVPDPYYGGSDGFEQVFEIVDRTSRNILESIAT